MTLYLKNTQHKKELAEWFKWQSLPSKYQAPSSNLYTTEKKKYSNKLISKGYFYYSIYVKYV
jgi:hypothetical protein